MKLSIVTVCRNDRKGLERTLASTFDLQPSFSDWEQIVVDGASTDGSRDVAFRRKDDPRTGWCVSEPDSGIYNAMNKGLARAKGDWVLFLNAGDALLPDVLAKVFGTSVEADVVYGDMVLSSDGGRKRTVSFPDGKEIVPAYFLFGSLPHQSAFISRSLFERFGRYDEDLKIVSDAKFFLDCALSGTVRFHHLSFPVSVFEKGGISTDPAKLAFGLEERRKWLAGVFGEHAAQKATYPSPPWWAGTAVRDEAVRDRGFARLLWCANRAALGCWRIPPVRFLLRCVLAAGARATRRFRT